MFNGSQLVNTGQLSANKRKTKHRQNCTPKKTDPETENKKKKQFANTYRVRLAVDH